MWQSWDLKRLKSHLSWIVIKEFLVLALDKYGDPANGGDHVVESSNELETQISWDPSYSWKCLHPSVNQQYSYLQRVVFLWKVTTLPQTMQSSVNPHFMGIIKYMRVTTPCDYTHLLIEKYSLNTYTINKIVWHREWSWSQKLKENLFKEKQLQGQRHSHKKNHY